MGDTPALGRDKGKIPKKLHGYVHEVRSHRVRVKNSVTIKRRNARG